jgi:ribosomal protein L37AE/L43A
MARRKCPPGCGCGKHTHVVRTSYEKQCVECGGSFTAKRVDARFCSGDCHRKWYDRENREKTRERHRRWAQAHRAEVRDIQRRYDERHKAERLLQYAEVSADPEKAAARQEAARRYYRDNRERILARAKERRAQDLMAKKSYQHGIEWEPLFAALWEAQGGKCYLCGDELRPDQPRAIHLDHDHSCCPLARSCERCRRGLACKDCNRLIGIARDDPDRLRRIADGLERANEAVRERMQVPRLPRIAEIRHNLICEECSTPFQATMSNTRCCSTRCYRRLRYRERLGSADGNHPRTCPECGRSFMSRTARGIYCSKPCSNKAYLSRKAAAEAADCGQQLLSFSP